MLLSCLLSLVALQSSPDTIVVRVAAQGPADGVPFVEELRLGSLDGPVEESFGFVSGFAVDDAGTVFIADAQAASVRVFDRDGRYVGTIGGEGEGPGEFKQIQGLALLPGGELATWDPGLFRVSLFDTDGRFLRSFPVQMRVIVGGVDFGFLADSSGNLLIRTSAEMPGGDGVREMRFAWLRYRDTGEFVDSLVFPRRDVGGIPAAFKIETWSAPSPLGYVVTGRNTEYALHRSLPDGRVVRIERDVPLVSFEAEERRQWSDYVAEWDRRWGYDSPGFPDAKPRWRSFSVDVQGRLWVSRYASAVRRPGYQSAAEERGGWPIVEWRQPEVLDVIDPRGAFLGTVTLPTGGQVIYSRGPHFWVLERGEFDEQYVVRYRAEGLGAGQGGADVIDAY